MLVGVGFDWVRWLGLHGLLLLLVWSVIVSRHLGLGFVGDLVLAFVGNFAFWNFFFSKLLTCCGIWNFFDYGLVWEWMSWVLCWVSILWMVWFGCGFVWVFLCLLLFMPFDLVIFMFFFFLVGLMFMFFYFGGLMSLLGLFLDLRRTLKNKFLCS